MSVPVKKLEDQLNCPICMDTYTNPKQLQCNHVYCQKCLVRLVDRDRQGQLSLTCPNCRQVTPVSASGVAGLQPAFRVNQLLEIVEEHKKLAAVTETASATPITHGTITSVCPVHNGNEVLLYCETCGETICWECIMKGSKHHSHKYEKLNEAFEKYKMEITSSLEPLEKKLMTVENALKVFNARNDEISDQRAAIESDIHNTITQLQQKIHQTLEVRKTELISQLDQLTQTKIKSLATQRDQLEITQAQLSSCILFIRENLKTGNQREALMMKSTTVRQMKELTTTFQQNTLEPNEEADIIFSAQTLSHLNVECQDYGKMYATSSPDPSKCFVTDSGIDTAAVGEISTAILHSLNFGSQPCMLSTSSITCEFVSEITGASAECSVRNMGQSQYEISYQPTIKGRHQLYIEVEGQHIRGSPFTVSVKLPVEKLGTSILTISGVEGAIGVALNQKGEVVVTECDGHSVSVFSPTGEKLRSFGTHGTEQGQFNHPNGVAVDRADNIYVADCSNHRIQKFSSDGEFLAAVGTEGKKLLQFSYPVGVAVSADNGRVYVVENGNNCIQILNPDLSFHGVFGSKGSGKGQFNDPRHIACDSTGSLYVADSGNHRIQVFTSEGVFLRMFGQERLESARGIAVDSTGRVYVSERWNQRVSVFASQGQFIASFGSEGERPGLSCHPHGLAVDSSGILYVCDCYNCGVLLF